MRPSKTTERSGLWAALFLWAMSVTATFVVGLDVSETNPKHWLGHWINNIWAFIGWLPILLFLRRKPEPPKDPR